MSSFNPFQIFNNPFDMEDLAIFDDSTLQQITARRIAPAEHRRPGFLPLQ